MGNLKQSNNKIEDQSSILHEVKTASSGQARSIVGTQRPLRRWWRRGGCRFDCGGDHDDDDALFFSFLDYSVLVDPAADPVTSACIHKRREGSYWSRCGNGCAS
jgi:hypothetical protein